MNIFRCILGSIAVVACVGFVALVMLANVARSLLSAPEYGPLFIVLPVVGGGILVAAISFPANKPLLHIAAVAAAGLVGFFVWQTIAEGGGMWLWFAYLAAWFVYYYLAAWHVEPQS